MTKKRRLESQESTEKPSPSTVQEVRARMRELYKKSGMTEHDIGIAMGYTESGARTAVSRLLSDAADRDPSLSTILKFAAAIGVKPASLFSKR